MLILKAYKFRLEPTPEQSQRLRQLCGCARFVWNLGLAETKRILDSGEKLPSAFELNRMITVWKKMPEYIFLQDAYTDNLQQKLKDLHTAWKRCFDKKLAAKAPVWKRKNEGRDSIRFVNFEKWQKQKRKIQCLHSRIANIRRDYLHKVTTTVSKNHAMIVIEDLKVSNMSKSAAGTVSQPGRNVRAKSGLNRSILDQGWYEMRRQLEYKQLWRGGQVLAVPPAYTSQRCACCGHTAKENRLSQSQFRCQVCGYTANADVNGARNILAAGHAVLACGGTMQSDRPLKQEPDAEQSAVTH
ncbi:TPA: RNA-guided endonuclease InsQ/TnpB family protein [Salmonella enterica subsp. enterica serovar Saintpaul]